MANERNLRPIQKGERRALKDPSQRKTERIPVMVTKARKAQLLASAQAQKLTLSAYLLKDK